MVDDLSTGSLENLPAVQSHQRLRSLSLKISMCTQLSELVSQADCICDLAAAAGADLVARSPIQVMETNLPRRRCCSMPLRHAKYRSF